MYLTTENKKDIFTTRINHLTQHLLSNKKDFSTQRALLKLVGKRRKLLDYLKEKDIERYRAIIKSLNIRK
jgi:small subunit ribosomal protein S15